MILAGLQPSSSLRAGLGLERAQVWSWGRCWHNGSEAVPFPRPGEGGPAQPTLRRDPTRTSTSTADPARGLQQPREQQGTVVLGVSACSEGVSPCPQQGFNKFIFVGVSLK